MISGCLVVLGFIALAIGCSALEAWIVMLLGNFVLGAIGVDFVLTFYVTWAVMIVLNIIFGKIRVTNS